MINWNGSSGGAVVFFTLFLAVMAEAWNLGADDVTTITEFEISEMGAAVLPAAVEDAKNVQRYFAETLEQSRKGQQHTRAEHLNRLADEMQPAIDRLAVLSWQANRLVSLLEHLNRINRPDVAEGVV